MKLVALLVITAAIGWATQCGHKITVYLRGRSVVPNPVWSQARNTAAKIFSAANVQIDWRTGDQLPVEKAIVVSIVAHAPVDSLRGALAFTRPYEGVHITVFWDRVEHPVRPASKGVILAHVLVHEITHILQGIDRHSETGIMKARWANQDFRDMAWKPLPLTPHDIMLMRLGREEFATGWRDSQPSGNSSTTVIMRLLGSWVRSPGPKTRIPATRSKTEDASISDPGRILRALGPDADARLHGVVRCPEAEKEQSRIPK